MTTKNTVTAIWVEGYEEVARLLSILGFKRIEAGPRGVSAIVPDPADLAEAARDLAESLSKLGITINVLGTFETMTSQARLIIDGALCDAMLGPIEYALVKFIAPRADSPDAPDFEVLETAPRFAPSEVGKATYKLDPDEYDLIPVRPRSASAA